MKTKMLGRAAITLLLPIMTLALAGCWTPPNANVQPGGEPRLIQSGVSVESVRDQAPVETMDASQRVLNLKLLDGTLITCHVNPQVKNFDQIQAGDKIKVTLAEKLGVYVLKDGRLPVAGGTDEVVSFYAKVQSVDPSYRLLTLQYVSGQTETLKAGLDAKLMEMQPGDSVVMEAAEALDIHIEKP